ncbi:MAG: preprotein translocase subunit SecG [Desulfosudaceae bacterium]
MGILITLVHIIACILLIVIILLQTGKGAGMGAAFGSGGSQTLFGSSGGSSFMNRVTTTVAVIFMITCLSLAFISTHRQPDSIMQDKPVPAEKTEPAGPAAGGENAQPQQGGQAD